MNMTPSPEEIEAQRQEWEGKLKLVPGTKKDGYAHFVADVEILEGDPSGEVLRNFADGWGFNFGGKTIFEWKKDGRRFARVKVYVD